MKPYRLDLRRAIDATDGAGRYADRLWEIEGRSGVYGILDRSSGELLYVGESHSGRLRETLLRHFRRWDVAKGLQYNRDGVRVAWVITPPGVAADLQYAEIQRLQPADNLVSGESIADLPI